ncbi:zinc knuckle CX2CX4HX4C containing protein [Tanacetum coccineum]
MRVFPITLTGAAKRWVDRLSPGSINTWELLKNAFIQRYCPPSKTTKQLEEIHNFKQVVDETLYQALERHEEAERECARIQVGCENCRGAYLNKDYPLHEEVKSVEEVKYGEFGRPFSKNKRNGARYRVGPSGYYTRMDNRPPFGEKKPSLEELMNKHTEESTRKRAEIE